MYLTKDLFYKRYDCGTKLGVGSFATVYLIRDIVHEQKHCHVAMKRFHKEHPPCIPVDGIPQRLVQEVKVLRVLRKHAHKNIINLLGVFVIRDTLNNNALEYALMFEYGQHTLHQLIQEEKFMHPHKKNYRFDTIVQLLRGVAHCHALDIIHRDINPKNIVICANGTLKLIDFGSSRTVNRHRDGRMSPKVTTLWWRAPELLSFDTATRQQSLYCNAVDMWAVGCVLGDMIKGKALFSCVQEDNELLLSNAHDAFVACPREWLPSTFDQTTREAEMLRGLLEKNPTARLSAKATLAKFYQE